MVSVLVIVSSVLYYSACCCAGWLACDYVEALWNGQRPKPIRLVIAVAITLAAYPYAWPSSVLLK